MSARDYLAKAQEIRGVAATVINEALRDELLATAQKFERLALSFDVPLAFKPDQAEFIPGADRPSAASSPEGDQAEGDAA
jgi:hypothetical protein